jgi:hypothetical protein
MRVVEYLQRPAQHIHRWGGGGKKRADRTPKVSEIWATI